MRYRVKRTKLATVHRLPVASRFRSGTLQTKVSCDLSVLLTREAITAVVYQLANAWGYSMVFDGDVAHVQAMLEPVYALSGDLYFVVPDLPTVVDCLMTAGRQERQD